MNKLKDAIYGFAVGDALGVPFEFKERGTFQCKGMIGFGTWNQPAGTWSDDTSMTLATCDSIREKGHVDCEDIMNKFVEWLNEARYTAGDHVFDVGGTTFRAISRYANGAPIDECGDTVFATNGNGSLMRILPLAFVNADCDIISRVSALTHAHEISVEECLKYVAIARKLINGHSLKSALGGEYARYKKSKRKDVSSSGFVVHTFDAAMWCLVHSKDYKDCVLSAVNLGEDTDTVAAVAGGLAGIIYGYDSIPEPWIEGLRNKKLIDSCIDWRFEWK